MPRVAVESEWTGWWRLREERSTLVGAAPAGHWLAVRYAEAVSSVRQWLARPGLGSRAFAALATIAALWPVLSSLPRVSLVACFDAAHPLYSLVPAEFGELHCLSAPAPVVAWTLMVGATLMVQLLFLPLVVTAGVVGGRALQRLARSTRRQLTLVLVELGEIVVPQRRPAPVRVRAAYADVHHARVNPHRGPPSCLS